MAEEFMPFPPQADEREDLILVALRQILRNHKVLLEACHMGNSCMRMNESSSIIDRIDKHLFSQGK